MAVRVSTETFKQTRWYQYLVRFVFGGLINTATGLIANTYGPVVGGLFLAVPSIFPASVTLVQVHKKQQEQQKDKGEEQSQESGEQAAGITAEGTVLGAFGLLAFAVIIHTLSTRLEAWLVLLIALLVWIAGSVLAWWVFNRTNKKAAQ